jgi:heme-degrading monooxygenase HmoA
VTGRFAPGQVVTVFRSRLLDDVDERYEPLNEEMVERARGIGGLVDVTSFVADDGERVTIVTFVDRESHDRWAADDVHRDAQRFGRERVYSEYSIQVTECTRTSSFVV